MIESGALRVPVLRRCPMEAAACEQEMLLHT